MGTLVHDGIEGLLSWYVKTGLSDRVATYLWKFHPEASYFLGRGGDRIPPPMFCNLALTNKCNLRCEICGSQKYLDETGVQRSHMELATFQAVAETMFPFMVEVELNSQGDPLLHPHIETILKTIAHYRCDIKVQTNGTLFTDRVIDAFMQQRGKVMLSLDAVGPRFDEVRHGGEWAKAEPQLVKFLRRRQRDRLRVGIYPTLTRRTVGEVMNVVQWSVDHGVEEVAFHRYSPIQNSFEEAPIPEELEHATKTIHDWLVRNGNVIGISLDGHPLNTGPLWMKGRRSRVHWNVKRMLAIGQHRMMFPREPDMHRADPLRTCIAPNYYVEIGLDGQLAACCRSQDVVLGYATSMGEFADAWFGENYDKIRRSLLRDATGPFPLPNCEECIEFYAPHVRHGRKAVDYDGSVHDPAALTWTDRDEIQLEFIQKESGYCHIVVLPPGLDRERERYQVWENETPLGPGDSLHDDIRKYGNGRYSIWGRNLYFSASDGTDARRNGRSYTLRKCRNELIMPARLSQEISSTSA
ncbi:MAG TPA: radical SAM protein [Nitrospira sp.]|nr:radical SAM protein [Nitrospira sp.]